MYTLTYDAENHLTAVSGAATASFTYDGDGNRVKGTVGAGKHPCEGSKPSQGCVGAVCY